MTENHTFDTTEPLVTVFLAVRNNAAWLSELLISILDGDYSNVRVVVRDDGSTDGSYEILSGFAMADHRVRVLPDRTESGGAMQNFFRLMTIKGFDGDYFMFADADDIWSRDKISKTLEKMTETEAGQKDVPVLVHTDLTVVGEDRSVINPSFFAYEKLSPDRNSLKELICQNNVTGCTVMFNRALRDLVPAPPEGAVMHDWWCALIAAAFGRIAVINEPLVLYRQHGGNQVGAYNGGSAAAAIDRLKNVEKTRSLYDAMFRQADAFADAFSDRLTPEQTRILRRFAEIRRLGPAARRARIITDGYWKNTLVRNLGLIAVI